MKNVLQHEVRAAFAKHVQPVCFRVAKYLVLGGFIWLCRHATYFWWTIIGLGISGVLLHGFYRYKTRGWTRSYGQGLLRWDYEKVMHKC